MAGISCKTLYPLENKHLYSGKFLNNKEFIDGSGLEWYDFGARIFDPQIGRWQIQDPLAGKYFSSTPYNYVDGNPVVRNDPDGQDWFKNQKTNDISWRAIEGRQGDELSLNGSEDTWVNLGSELLQFNGETLFYFTQSKDKDGNLTVNAEAFDAVSGKPEITTEYNSRLSYDVATGSWAKKDFGTNFLTFKYSKEQQQKGGVGPAPEGLYSINKSIFVSGKNENGLQNWDDLSEYQKTLSTLFARGLWGHGYGTSSWGEHRWRLNAEGVNTFRNGFFLHGGSGSWGSQGCIDVGNQTGVLTNALLTNKTGNDKVYLNVVYPKDFIITIQSTSTDRIIKK